MDVIWNLVSKNPEQIPLYLILVAWMLQNMVFPFLKALTKQQQSTDKVVGFAHDADVRHDDAINKLLELLGRNLVSLGDNLTALKEVGVRQMNILEEVRDTTTAHRKEFGDAQLVRRVGNIEKGLQAAAKLQAENRQLLVYLVKAHREKKL